MQIGTACLVTSAVTFNRPKRSIQIGIFKRQLPNISQRYFQKQQSYCFTSAD